MASPSMGPVADESQAPSATPAQTASDTLGGVATQRPRTIPQAPPPAAPEQPHTWMGDLLRAIGNVHDDHVTKGQLIGGIASTLIRGAAAGAAQRGPGAAGRALEAGVESQTAFQQRQLENQRQAAEQQRLTQQAADQHTLAQASLAKSNQDIARSTLDMKFKQQELDEHQVSLAESLQDLKSIPGSKVLGHFDSNKDVNDHLEQVGPDLAKKYAVDLSKNRIQLIPSPGGGFDAVEVPIDWDKQAVGDGHKIHIVSQTQDPKTKKVTLGLSEYDAPANMTQGEYQRLEKQTFTDYTGAQNAQLEQQKTKAGIAHEQAGTAKEQTETKVLQQQIGAGGGSTGVINPQTGADEGYLQTLPPAQANLVRAIGEGRTELSTRAATSKDGKLLMQQLTTAYPNFDSSRAASYAATRKDFTSGKTSTGINSYNTAIAHLGTMYDHVTGTNSLQLNNPFADVHRQLDIDKQLVSTELAKAVSNGQMTEGEKNSLLNSISGATVGSYKTRIKEAVQLLHGKLEAYQQQWNNGAPPGAVSQVPILSRNSETTLNRIQSGAEPMRGTQKSTGKPVISYDGGRTWQLPQ